MQNAAVSSHGKDAYSAYIAKYSGMAVEQMKKYGIWPVSLLRRACLSPMPGAVFLLPSVTTISA